eukprot:9474856-Pyramimonas_sp.AAC.1
MLHAPAPPAAWSAVWTPRSLGPPAPAAPARASPPPPPPPVHERGVSEGFERGSGGGREEVGRGRGRSKEGSGRGRGGGEAIPRRRCGGCEVEEGV